MITAQYALTDKHEDDQMVKPLFDNAYMRWDCAKVMGKSANPDIRLMYISGKDKDDISCWLENHQDR